METLYAGSLSKSTGGGSFQRRHTTLLPGGVVLFYITAEQTDPKVGRRGGVGGGWRTGKGGPVCESYRESYEL